MFFKTLPYQTKILEFIQNQKKFAIHFHRDNGPKFYFAHGNERLVYEAYHEQMFPITTEIFEVMKADFGCSFNWLTFHIYFDWNSHIGLHRDSNQTKFKSENLDTIVTLSLFGSKLLNVTLDSTNEKCIFLHEMSDIYMMHGMQNFTHHSKLASKFASKELLTLFPQLQEKPIVHISMVVRELENWTNLPRKEPLKLPISINWNDISSLKCMWTKGKGLHWFD